MTSASEASVAAQTEDCRSRDAKNPFSELRGLIERASPDLTNGNASVKAVADLIRRGYEHQRPKARTEPRFDDDAALIVGAVQALGPLLDERDRLIGALERVCTIDPAAYPSSPPNNAGRVAFAVRVARSALSDQGEG